MTVIRILRTLVGVLALAGFVLLTPAAAAHVSVDTAAPGEDGTATVTLVWDHSCTEEAVTTGLVVSAGPGVEFTGASTGPAGWTFVVAPDEITFDGPGIPTGQKAQVEVLVRISAAPGEAVILPSVQLCGTEQLAWADTDPASEHPAPSLIVTSAIAAPAAPASPGADASQVLIGILVLVVALGALGWFTARGAGDR